MKASELRIGNWCSDNAYNDFKITIEHLLILHKGEDIQRIHPIPLTEEWLVKFGFEKDVDDLVLDINTVFFVFYNDGEFVRLKSNHLETITSIQYVHQLQNLYFALTGEELNLTK